MIGEIIFNRKLCDDISGKSSEFKNSAGKLTASSGSTTVLINLSGISLPGNTRNCYNLKLITSTSIFFAAKMARSRMIIVISAQIWEYAFNENIFRGYRVAEIV